jgi:pSer/pThr/pTyr-binding forkhead associated (FHA) protein
VIDAMQPEVSLILTDDTHRCRNVPIRSGRFTIGRGADNDLAIDGAGLSRRQALIEIHDGVVQLSDCGSLNGTLVNGNPVTAPTVVTDGDLISIGGAAGISLRVEFANARNSVPASETTHGDDHVVEQPPARLGWSLDWVSFPVLASASMVTILLVAVALLVFLGRANDGGDISVSDQRRQEKAQPSQRVEVPPESSTVANASAELGTCGAASAVRIEDEAVQVINRTTGDRQRYEFPPGALTDIKESIERFCKLPDVSIALRSITQHKAEIIADVRRNGQGIEPYLIAYAVLARPDVGGAGGDYVAVARQMLPLLVATRIHFGTDADSTLIVLAASTLGPGTKKSHPLLPVIRRIVESNPSAKRNIWYLNEHNGLSREAYGFVIRFLALGIIAQNPRLFGIEAEPVAF